MTSHSWARPSCRWIASACSPITPSSPDADGRRVFELAGKIGKLDATGKLSVDRDGAPHEVEVTVTWGTFVTRRLDQ